jgi:hypothetical protein
LTDTGINIAGIRRILELQHEIRDLQAQLERTSPDRERQSD